MTVFLLIDCNNFYVSCQRIFAPDLEKHPVVVLSNNDGCIISRSNEVKALGVPMGAPYFKYRTLLTKHNVKVFSSNYELYGDISNRIMMILRDLCPDMEVYSIDEAFLRIDTPSENLIDFCMLIRHQIKTWIGIPVSIGIGPSKTLAKVANKIAKNQNLTGICDLSDTDSQNQALSEFKIENIWGIGHRLAKRFHQLGIHTAQQLRDASAHEVRQRFGVTVERTVLELRGQICLHLQHPSSRKNIICSRSFQKALMNIQDIEEAISQFVAMACLRLRKQQSKAQGIYIFLQTNLFSPKENPYSNGVFSGFAIPTSDTTIIIQTAKHYLQKIYLPNLSYKKAGIMLTDVIHQDSLQNDLFIQYEKQEKRDTLMYFLDKINAHLGKRSLFLAAEGLHPNPWQHFSLKSPCFTTNWADLLKVH